MAKEQTVRIKDKDRNDIIQRALIARFEERYEALKAREIALFWNIFDACLPKEMATTIRTLSDKWIEKERSAKVLLGGQLVFLDGTETVVDPDGRKYRRDVFPRKRDGAWGPVDDPVLVEQYRKIVSDQEDLSKERQSVYFALQPLLDQCKTLRQLRTIWPEGEEFYDWLAPEPKITLPAIQIEKINELLGLKKETV